jgi:hypothetical protein
VYFVNVPLSKFLPGAAVIGDLCSTSHSILLGAFAFIGSDVETLTEYKVDGENSPYYFDLGKPRFVVVLETLKAADNKDRVQGYRFWFFFLDPKLNLREGLQRLIVRNKERLEQQEQRLIGADKVRSNPEVDYKRAEGIVHGALPDSPHLRVYNERGIVFSALRPYAQRGAEINLHDAVSMDDIYSHGLLHAGSPFDPCVIMNDDDLFMMDNVCEQQNELQNYRKVASGEEWTDFMGTFPIPDCAVRLQPHCLSENILTHTPLPDVVKKSLQGSFERVLHARDMVKKAEARKQQLEDEGSESNELKIAQEDVVLQENMVVFEMQRFDDRFDQLRRDAPSVQMRGMSSAFDMSSVEKEFENRNALRQMHRAYEQKFADIRARFRENENDDGLIDGSTYPEIMRVTRMTALEQFWKVLNTANNVTTCIKTARRWFSQLRLHDEGSHWSRNFALADNLTPFGNAIVRETNDYGSAYEINTNMNLMWVFKMVFFAAAEFGFKLRMNALCTGEASMGKSYAAKKAAEGCIPGAEMNLTRMTSQSMNSGEDISDTTIVIEEAPFEMLGIDRYGKQCAADEGLKNRMTSGVSTTLQLNVFRNEETGLIERRPELMKQRTNVTHIFIGNEKLPPGNSASLSRFMHYVMRDYSRPGLGMDNDRVFCPANDSVEVLEAVKEVFHGHRLHHWYFFLAEKAIEAGVLPNVNVEVSNIVCKWVFDELAARKVPAPSQRHKGMLIDLCRILTIWYSIEVEFFSEYGWGVRAQEHLPPEVKNGFRPATYEDIEAAHLAAENEEFQPHMLESLIKYWVSTTEITVFAITLLDFLWIPRTRTDVIEGFALLAGVQCVTDKDTGKVSHIMSPETKYRRNNAVEQPVLAPAPGQGPQEQQDAFAAQVDEEFDYNYIEIQGNTTRDIVCKLGQVMKDAPSENDILGALTQLTSEFIYAKPKHWVNEDPFTGDLNASGVPKSVLEDKEDQPEELIPVCIIDSVSTGVGNKASIRRRVCIAVDVLRQNFSTTLHDAIKSALSYNKTIPGDYITAFPYQSFNATGECETHHTVYDTIRLEQIPEKKRYVLHSFCRTKAQMRGVLSRRFGGGNSSFFKDDTPVREVDETLESIQLQRYWNEQGIDPAKTGPAYLPYASRILQRVREDNDVAFPASSRIRVYPRDWISEIQEQQEKTKLWAGVNITVPNDEFEKNKAEREKNVVPVYSVNHQQQEQQQQQVEDDGDMVMSSGSKRTVSSFDSAEAKTVNEIFENALKHRKGPQKRARWV